MGIRVHKLLGYGLTDIATSADREWEIDDPRVNSKSPGLTYTAPSIDEYRTWLEAQRESGDIEIDLELSFLREPEPGDPRFDLDTAIVHQGEFGMPNVLVICPPTYQRRWSRFDDAIDYIEETYLRKPAEEPQANHIETLRHGIYPFIGYMDKRTGEGVDDKIFNWIRGTNAEKKLAESELDVLAQYAGFESSADAWENVAPVVPRDIKNVATFLDLFTDDKAWLQLRPVLYTYWS
jgi:hypothetical protein